jgi:hypothetical protein
METKVEETKLLINQEAEVVQNTKGIRGEIGLGTPSSIMKNMYHATHFTREDSNNKKNPNKKVWVKNHRAPSLKQFARKQAADGNVVAKDFLANKLGAKDQKRSDANVALAKTIATATKLTKKGSKK